jgi:hypothetical protein
MEDDNLYPFRTSPPSPLRVPALRNERRVNLLSSNFLQDRLTQLEQNLTQQFTETQGLIETLQEASTRQAEQLGIVENQNQSLQEASTRQAEQLSIVENQHQELISCIGFYKLLMLIFNEANARQAEQLGNLQGTAEAHGGAIGDLQGITEAYGNRIDAVEGRITALERGNTTSFSVGVGISSPIPNISHWLPILGFFKKRLASSTLEMCIDGGVKYKQNRATKVLSVTIQNTTDTDPAIYAFGRAENTQVELVGKKYLTNDTFDLSGSLQVPFSFTSGIQSRASVGIGMDAQGLYVLGPKSTCEFSPLSAQVQMKLRPQPRHLEAFSWQKERQNLLTQLETSQSQLKALKSECRIDLESPDTSQFDEVEDVLKNAFNALLMAFTLENIFLGIFYGLINGALYVGVCLLEKNEQGKPQSSRILLMMYKVNRWFLRYHFVAACGIVCCLGFINMLQMKSFWAPHPWIQTTIKKIDTHMNPNWINNVVLGQVMRTVFALITLIMPVMAYILLLNRVVLSQKPHVVLFQYTIAGYVFHRIHKFFEVWTVSQVGKK